MTRPKRTVTAEELAQPLLGYEDAVSLVLGAFAPLPATDLPLTEALGLVAASDVVSPVDVPGFASSAMDGYAVRSADVATVPVRLRVRGQVAAGTRATQHVEPGTAITTMTGGAIPPGADSVVPWEDTERDGEEIVVFRPAPPGRHVRPAAEDVRRGDVVVRSGDLLTPVRLGVLASTGATTVSVHPRPRVAILSTGDELAPPGRPLPFGFVYDANTTLLASVVRQAGGNVTEAATLPDDPEAIATWLGEVRADLVVTSGGASVGEHDWVREVLRRQGELAMWRVAMKPGKPVALGRLGPTPVLALPGNPGSAFACAHTFVVPAIRRLLGRSPAHRTVRSRLSEAVAGSASRTLLCRVRLEGELALPLPAQSSVVLSNLIGADGFAIVPPGGLGTGAEVIVELFEEV